VISSPNFVSFRDAVREKFSCRECETIAQPPAPFHVTPRGFAGPNLLAMILFEKFGQHRTKRRAIRCATIGQARAATAHSSLSVRRQISGASSDGSTSTCFDAVQQRLDANPQAMRQRRETVEHPFATLKMRMGATHFLMKRLPKVATEMALHVLA
jgi:hypothetical protein